MQNPILAIEAPILKPKSLSHAVTRSSCEDWDEAKQGCPRAAAEAFVTKPLHAFGLRL